MSDLETLQQLMFQGLSVCKFGATTDLSFLASLSPLCRFSTTGGLLSARRTYHNRADSSVLVSGQVIRYLGGNRWHVAWLRCHDVCDLHTMSTTNGTPLDPRDDVCIATLTTSQLHDALLMHPENMHNLQLRYFISQTSSLDHAHPHAFYSKNALAFHNEHTNWVLNSLRL